MSLSKGGLSKLQNDNSRDFVKFKFFEMSRYSSRVPSIYVDMEGGRVRMSR